MPQLEASVNDSPHLFDVDELAELDLVATGTNRYHFIHRNVGYTIEVLAIDRGNKTVDLRVNGREQRVRIADEVDLLVRKLGLATVETTAGGDLYAPMPGLVLDVMAAPGQQVEAGAPLIVLEAMKMENVLKAEAAGTVESIAVAKGEAVEKKQLLVAFTR